jgi:hypothetical protein
MGVDTVVRMATRTVAGQAARCGAAAATLGIMRLSGKGRGEDAALLRSR